MVTCLTGHQDDRTSNREREKEVEQHIAGKQKNGIDHSSDGRIARHPKS